MVKIIKHKLCPYESQDITNDHWHHISEDLLISTWNPVESEMQVASVLSIFELSKGVQISKKFNAQGQLKYWYCDLIAARYEDEALHITDLILDLVIFPDGVLQVIDVSEYQKYTPQSPWETKVLKEAPKNLSYLMRRWIDN